MSKVTDTTKGTVERLNEVNESGLNPHIKIIAGEPVPVNPVWDVQAPMPDVGDSLEEYEFFRKDFPDVNSGTKASKETYDITVTDLDKWIKWSDAEIDVRAQMVDNSTKAVSYDTNERVALNNISQGAFRNFTLEFDGQRIGDMKRYVGDEGLIKAILRDEGADKSVENVFRFMEDGLLNISTASSSAPAVVNLFDSTLSGYTGTVTAGTPLSGLTASYIKTEVDRTGNPKGYYDWRRTNKSFMKRQYYSTRANIYFRIRLREVFDFLYKYRKPIKGTKVKISFEKNGYKNMFHRVGTTTDAYLNIDRMELHYPVLKPNTPTESYLIDQRRDNIAVIWNEYTVHKSPSVPSTTQYRWTIDNSAKMPQYVYAFVQKAARIDTQVFNNMIYDNLDMKNISIYINSTKYPTKIDFKKSFSDNDYAILYRQLENAARMEGNRNFQLSLEQFQNVYSIIAIPIVEAQTLYANKGIATLDVEIEFNSATSENFYVGALVVSKRNLVLDYKQDKLQVIV